MEDLELYLDTLYAGLDGLVYSPVKTENSWEINWFEWPGQKSELQSHILTANGDVYVSPAVYSERRATKDSIKKIHTVWVEFDGAEYIDFASIEPPTLIVQTSFDTHVHCYWRLDKPANQATVEDINRRLTYHLKADSSGWDSTQLLRPPHTINRKHGKPVLLTSSQKTAHPVGIFWSVPVVAQPPVLIAEISDLLPVGTILKEKTLPSKVKQMVMKETPIEPYRSSFLSRLANELAEESLSHLEIVSLLKEADTRIKKYDGRSDQLLRLSQIADYAIHKHIAEEAILVFDPEYVLTHVENVQWILPNWLHSTGLLILSSAPGVGKTQLALQLAYCLTGGKRFLGMLAPSKYRVFFMSLEMHKQSLKYILEHQQHEWDSIPYFPIIDEQTNLTGYENLIAEHESNVLMVDSLTELFDDTVDNPNQEARRIMKWCRKIQRRYGVALILIHHNRKATESNRKPKGLSDLAGSFQFGKESDTVVQLWEDNKGIELSLVKARFGPKESFMIDRNANLWYTRKGKEDVSNTNKSTRTDSPGNSGQQDSSDRLGNSVYGNATGAFNSGFGNKD